MYTFIFTKKSKKDFKNLDSTVQNRVLEKLQFYKTVENISDFIKPLTNFLPATHRLRVGNFRLILEQVDDTTFLILKIGKRGNIYK